MTNIKNFTFEKTKRVVRELINNYMNTYQINVVAEAKLCFEYATELFKEMNEYDTKL